MNDKPFNIHESRTADGVTITHGLHVFTNEMKVGLVTDAGTATCCEEIGCKGVIKATQKQVDGVWYSDHEAVAALNSSTRCSECGTITSANYCGCKHDHWFTVTHLDGTTSSMNGERLSTTFRTYEGSTLKAIDEYERTQQEQHVEASLDLDETPALTEEQIGKALDLLEEHFKVTIDRDNRPRQGTNPLYLSQWLGGGYPRPALLWEGGPEGWDYVTFNDEGTELRERLTELGVYIEAYSSWAICFYPTVGA